MRQWLAFDGGRRGFLGLGLLTAQRRRPRPQRRRAGNVRRRRRPTGLMGAHPVAPGKPKEVSAHRQAHGAMITVGDVDSARNGFDPTEMLTDWELGEGLDTARGRKLHFRGLGRGQGDRDRAGRDVPQPGPTTAACPAVAARRRGRAAAHRVQELWVAPALDAFPRHPFRPHGRRAGRRPDWARRGIRLRVRREAVRLPPVPLPRAAAGAPYPQGHVRPVRHRPGPDGIRKAATWPRSRLHGTPENAEWQELAMVMNAFDTTFDGENEFYACNTIAHCYAKKPIRIEEAPAGSHLSRQRDRVRSDQLLPPARQFLRLFRPGHNVDADAQDRRLIVQCQAQRGILEFTFAEHRSRPLHVPRAPVGVHRTWLDGHVRRGRGGVVNQRPTSPSTEQADAKQTGAGSLVWLIAPLALLAAAIWWLIATNPLASFDNGAPPVEQVTVERTIIGTNGVRLLVRAGGARADDGGAGSGRRRLLGSSCRRRPGRWSAARRPGLRFRSHGCSAKRITSPSSPRPAPSSTTRSRWRWRHPRREFLQLGRTGHAGRLRRHRAGCCRPDVLPALREVQGRRHGLPAGAHGRPARYLLVDTLEDAFEFAGDAAALFRGR